MAAAVGVFGVDVHHGTLQAGLNDLVSLSAGGRVVTVLNWSGARLLVVFDPTITTVYPDENTLGVKVIPPGNHRVFLRRGQNRPIVALVGVVGAGAAEYTIDGDQQ